jgi:hypothetical protein
MCALRHALQQPPGFSIAKTIRRSVNKPNSPTMPVDILIVSSVFRQQLDSPKKKKKKKKKKNTDSSPGPLLEWQEASFVTVWEEECGVFPATS